MHGNVIRAVLAARALRAFADGFAAILLPAYLLALGYGEAEVGLLGTSALAGSALVTLAIGRWGHRFALRRLLLALSVAMAATGAAFAALGSLWPLLAVAFAGTLNPSSGSASVFVPLEHTAIAAGAEATSRTAAFARYSFFGSLFGAAGALAAAAPAWLVGLGWPRLEALRAMFLAYALAGVAVWALYRRVPASLHEARGPGAGLGPSRGIVLRLAALFSVDSFAGGLVVNSLLALWLFRRFGLSLAEAGAFFFWAGLAGAASQLAAPALARRIGLINTMVWTHIPSSLCLIGAALAHTPAVALGLLLARSLLSQMDVPARSAYVMSVVTPAERPAAASFTSVPRSLAAAAGPAVTGALFAAGALAAPLVACGALKIAYDLALYVRFKGDPDGSG